MRTAVETPGSRDDGRTGAAAAPDVTLTTHRRWRLGLPLALAGADVAALVIALAIADRLGHGAVPAAVRIGDHSLTHDVGGLAAVAVWSSILALQGAYSPSMLGTAPEDPRPVLRAGITFFALVAVVDLVWTTNLSSRLVAVVTAVAVASTLAVRVVGALAVRRARRRHRWMRRAVVYGGTGEAAALATLLERAPHRGVEVVGTCTAESDGQPGAGPPPAGRHDRRPSGNGVEADDQVVQALSSAHADMLAVAAGTPSHRLRSLAWRLEGTGVEVLVAPAVSDVARHAVAARPVGVLPLLRVEGCRIAGARLAVKNVIDRLGAALLLVLLSPVMVAAAVAVKLTSPGPVLYHQNRVGQDGRTFDFLKFRTMVSERDPLMPELAGWVDADGRLVKIHLARCNEADGLLFRVRDDPRVTRVGRVLRRYSIDELPQLWHVLRGEMSLVGPRPLAVSPEDFVGDARRRLRVKPGITGLWQISGRRDLSWDDTVRLDLEYVDRWSFPLDLKILLRTPAAALRGRGAS